EEADERRPETHPPLRDRGSAPRGWAWAAIQPSRRLAIRLGSAWPVLFSHSTGCAPEEDARPRKQSSKHRPESRRRFVQAAYSETLLLAERNRGIPQPVST